MKRLIIMVCIALSVGINPITARAGGHGFCGGGWHGGYCGGWHGGYCGGWHGGCGYGGYGGCWPGFSIGFGIGGVGVGVGGVGFGIGVGYPAYGSSYSYPRYRYPYAYAPAGYPYARPVYAYQPAPAYANVAVAVQPSRVVSAAPVYAYSQRVYVPARPQTYVAAPNTMAARPATQPGARAASAPVNGTRVQYWPGKLVPVWHDNRQTIAANQSSSSAPAYVVSR